MTLNFTPPIPDDKKKKCPRCHAPWQMVVVHGHEQCAYCKSNVIECCSGDICELQTMRVLKN